MHFHQILVLLVAVHLEAAPTEEEVPTEVVLLANLQEAVVLLPVPHYFQDQNLEVVLTDLEELLLHSCWVVDQKTVA